MQITESFFDRSLLTLAKKTKRRQNTFFQNADTIEEALNILSQQVMHDMKREYSEIDFSVCKTLIDYCNEIYYVTKKAMQEIFC